MLNVMCQLYFLGDNKPLKRQKMCLQTAALCRLQGSVSLMISKLHQEFKQLFDFYGAERRMESTSFAKYLITFRNLCAQEHPFS